MFVPVIDVKGQNLDVADGIATAVRKIIGDGQYVLGPSVEKFEQQIAERLQVRCTVAVNSGTDALILALRALGVGREDVVATTPNTFIATVAAIRHVGAVPCLIDVGADENIDPEALARAITPSTRAVIAVHLRGRPANMDDINRIAKSHGIHVLEDASQAFGAKLASGPVGRLGTIGCFSLHPQKILGACGDAGMITTDDPLIADKLRLLRNHGLRGRDDVVVWGFNSRLDSIQAEILLLKLRYVDEWIKRHRRVAKLYELMLSGLPLSLPRERPGEFAVYYQYSVFCEKRNELLAHLKGRQVDARVHYPVLVSQQQVARDCLVGPGGLPNAERQARCQLSLPMFAGLADDQVLHVVNSVRSYFDARQLSSIPEVEMNA